ncbi:hypothetical protein [Streptomyces sp. NPDC020362]|uniref:hypothetical protein n=1 Tax=unclassified Streptomyces TaxID=2593676 RepID=UPI00340A7C16
MRRPLALPAVLAGCVHVSGGVVPPPLVEAAAIHTPSLAPVPAASQAPARTALVDTRPSRTTQQHSHHEGTRRTDSRSTWHQQPRAQAPGGARVAGRTAPPRRATEHQHTASTPRQRHGHLPRLTWRHAPFPRTFYDLHTLCALTHQRNAPARARVLCDTYVR